MKRLVGVLALIAGLAVPATAHADASYSVSPGSIDFGSVSQGADAASQVIVITNTSTAGETLYVNGASWLDLGKNPVHEGWSGIHSCDYTVLAAGQQCGLTIAFQANDTLGLHTNGIVLPVEGQDTVPCSWDPTQLCDGPIGSTTVAVAADVTSAPQPPPPATVARTSLSARSFYPLVQDGYRDSVRYSFRLSAAASGAVRVYNRAGRRVMSWSFHSATSGSVGWRGRSSRGRLVAAGYYRFQVRLADGNTSAYRSVRVRSGFRYVHHSRSRLGRYVSTRSCAGGSFAELACWAYPYGNEYWLQSTGARSTSAWYRFKAVPGAYRCTVQVDWHDGPWHSSCARSGRRGALVRVWVPNGAAATVARVTVDYRTRRRI